MKRTPYQPAGVFEPAGKAYSHGVIVEAGRTLYVAGQTARDAQGKIVGKGDAAAQTRQLLENMKQVVEGAGGRMEDVAKTTVFLVDMGDFPVMNDVYAEAFAGHRPARSTVAVAALPLGARVEVEVWAYVPR